MSDNYEKIAGELDYQPIVNNHSTTVYRTVVPQGTNTVTLSASSSVGPTEFVIPSSVWKPKLCKLNFQLNMVAAAGTTLYHWLDANALSMISRIVLYDSATATNLADVSNFEKYAAIVCVPATSIDTFLTKANYGATAYAGAATSVLSTPYPMEDMTKNNIIGGNNYTGTPAIGTTTVADVGTYNLFTGRQKYYISPIAPAAFIMDFSIPFSAFKFTTLSAEKLLYSPSNLVLQIYFNKIDNFMWDSLSNTAASTPISVVTVTTLNNISLTLANEGNPGLVSQIINKVMTSGIAIEVGYPTVVRQSLSATTAPSYQLQLTRGLGDRILFIASAPFAVDNTTVNFYNAHNRGLMTTMNTFLNNVAIKSPNGFDCSKGTDYTIANKEFLKGSCISTAGQYVFQDWCWIDSFFGEKPLWAVSQHEVDGLDVGGANSTWSFQATTGNLAQTWITCIVGQRTLIFTSGGVSIR